MKSGATTRPVASSTTAALIRHFCERDDGAVTNADVADTVETGFRVDDAAPSNHQVEWTQGVVRFRDRLLSARKREEHQQSATSRLRRPHRGNHHSPQAPSTTQCQHPAQIARLRSDIAKHVRHHSRKLT